MLKFRRFNFNFTTVHYLFNMHKMEKVILHFKFSFCVNSLFLALTLSVLSSL